MPELEEMLAELVHALNRHMLGCVEPVAREHQLSRMAMLVLRLVQASPGGTISDLARKTEIAKSHISNTVELLSEQGFVEKRPDAQDRRLIHLYPTERARELGQTILTEARRSLADVLDDVPPETVAALVDSLSTVLAAFERHAAGHGKPSSASAAQVARNLDRG
jgi:DNA-binding MarR family transcriptional regulator